MKTIVISANTSWYLYNFRKNTILALLEDGYNVFAVSPRDDYVEHLESLGCKHKHVYIDQGSINPLKDLVTLISFVKAFIAIRPQVVLNFTPKNNIYGNIAARIVNAKIINNIAGLGKIFVNKSFVTKLVMRMYKFSLHLSDKVFFQNEEDRSEFIKYKLVDSSKSDRLPGSGVDLKRFIPLNRVDDGKLKFLLIGRMLYEKGVAHYVEAAEILKRKYEDKLEFYLLGSMDVNNSSVITKDKMQSWVKSGAVIYLGVSDKVDEEIQKIDCVVLPSYYREGVPKTLLEAGAMGKPIITTDHTGCRETVDDGITGFLCEKKSTSSLCEKLERFISLDANERKLMGEKSREKIAEKFDENIVIEKYKNSIKSLIENLQ